MTNTEILKEQEKLLKEVNFLAKKHTQNERKNKKNKSTGILQFDKSYKIMRWFYGWSYYSRAKHLKRRKW